MDSEFEIQEPMTFKMNGNFGDKEESVITQKTIRKYYQIQIKYHLDISKQQRSARKCITIVQGIPDDIDLERILKFWKKVRKIILIFFQTYKCHGSVKSDPKTNDEYIAISGDHREGVATFLEHEGIGTKETIKVHGAI